ncbi:maleylpyruvate isomerase N-terminal domain-containing protein [Dactylosporangium sp. CA-092794]|uniref:maleylpyruvate isomerase N-terminal domain-containing protein n=1 Tax=Dactylosporangium sp. CA-092794 TaxID=3239929 RepID=UPI003D8DF88F
MERSRLLQCLAADYMRLREVAGTGLTAPVPSCPGWTVTDLLRHVGQVYLHKATVMHTGAWPDPWPPEETRAEPPIALLDRAYGALTHAFSRRGDTDPALTWHAPDQTAKFWIRRMAQETVIHRLDAELALHTESDPIPEDLALDGIDEVLSLFVAYGSRAWHEDFAEVLSTAKGRTVRVEVTPAASRAWLVRTDPAGASVSAVPSPGARSAQSFPAAQPVPTVQIAPDAVVSGPPAAVLRWLWARESTPTADAPTPVRVEGDEEAIKELRALLTASTQ